MDLRYFVPSRPVLYKKLSKNKKKKLIEVEFDEHSLEVDLLSTSKLLCSSAF